MFVTVLFSCIILVACVVLMSVGIILKKGGTFPNTHIGGSKAMAEKGIYCATTQDRIAANRLNIFERINLKK